jgi:hypothetical protein
MTDDRIQPELEDRLRETLAARDPGGAAPAGLQERIARVSTIRPRSSLPLVVRSTHTAVALLATAAAIVVGLVGVSALRTAGPGTIGVGGSAPPSPSAGVAVEPGNLPLPLTLDGTAVAAALAIGVVLLWYVAEALAAQPQMRVGEQDARWRFPRGLGWLRRAGVRRSLFALALAAAVASPWVVGAASRLGEGSGAASSSVDLLGGRTGFGGQKSILFYSGTPGQTISVTISLHNRGWVPLTVLGLDPGQADAGYELRRFESEDPNILLSPDQASTVPFTPFELAPGEERDVVFVDHLAICPILGAGTPSPSPGKSATQRPSASPDMENYGPPNGATESSIDTLPIRFSAFGLSETNWVGLAWSLIIVNPSPTCP